MPPAADATTFEVLGANRALRFTTPSQERMRNDEPRPDTQRPHEPAHPREDAVQEASEESFPASDPPSWEPLHSGSPAEPERDRDTKAADPA